MASDITVCLWNELLEYEKSDVILFILRSINSSFFRNDSLKLTEREEIRRGCVSSTPTVEKRLLLYGSVSYGRKDVFLSLVRSVRLRRVDDFATNVSLRYMVGDELPDCFLEPLVVSAHTKSFLRWYRVGLAIKYGIMKRMQTRIERVRQRLEMILKGSISANTSTLDEMKNENGSIHSTSTVPSGCDKSDSSESVANFSKYVAALEENQINIRQMSTSVPTLFILWSCQDFECIEWLRKNIFNRRTGKTLSRACVTCSQETSNSDDSWMELVKKYANIAERPINLTERGKLDGFKSPKRAQIVLINVDRNLAEARASFIDLCWCCSGWCSPEVSLISLWSGAEGLQSEICNMFNPIVLPFLIVTHPVKKRNLLSSPYRAHPCITKLIPLAAVDTSRDHESVDLSSQTSSSHWSDLDPQHRLTLASRICSLIFQLSLPMSFYAQVDHVYIIRNPYTDISTKAIESTCTSMVSLQGQISDRDMRSISAVIEPFVGLVDFRFQVNIVKCSAPLNIKQDPVLPVYYTFLKNKVISCTSCFRSIDVYTSPLYRCLHCLQRCGVICHNCFQSNSSRVISRRHPQNHIFARIPPVVCAIGSLPVLWGPSNVFPLQPPPIFASQSSDTSNMIHLGIYCDECHEMIRGVRWKCAVCYSFDYCNVCFEKQMPNELEFLQECTDLPNWLKDSEVSQAPQKDAIRRVHEPSHPMLCIPPHFLKGTNGNDFLQPVSLKLKDVLS
ncbi:unnamed protein product [Phytomonas sp. EM1]|nr:unnamed protein product [Phytomonas sp. EM1]|eukprot:CCW59804.1 unnamed protein product [Phytomonas sp. isolate EM1]